jgi:hypothetical protein
MVEPTTIAFPGHTIGRWSRHDSTVSSPSLLIALNRFVRVVHEGHLEKRKTQYVRCTKTQWIARPRIPRSNARQVGSSAEEKNHELYRKQHLHD